MPRFQAATIIALIDVSTGVKSDTTSGSPYDVRNKPMPQAMSKPVGPLKLSIHPVLEEKKLSRN